MIYLVILLEIIAWAAYASMWTLQFHYYQSIFTLLNNEDFWNPLRSSNNKYKNGNKSEGEAFLFSSTLLVFLTDGFHRMQFIFENSMFLAFALYNDNYKWYWGFLVLRVIYGIVFNLFFDKILIKKK